jgi:signal transduction histidine kinase
MSPTLSDVNVLLVDDLQENLVALEALIRQPGPPHLHRPLGRRSAVADAGALLRAGHPGRADAVHERLRAGRADARHRAHARHPDRVRQRRGRELNYAFRGYESGAVDFLYKPLDPHAVRSKVNVFVDLFRQRQELQAAQAQLQRAVTMRDDFMSMVSHELRNPLNSVYLQAQLRARCCPARRRPTAAMLKMVERDERQIRSMVRLLDDMLDVSRLRTGTWPS